MWSITSGVNRTKFSGFQTVMSITTNLRHAERTPSALEAKTCRQACTAMRHCPYKNQFAGKSFDVNRKQRQVRIEVCEASITLSLRASAAMGPMRYVERG